MIRNTHNAWIERANYIIALFILWYYASFHVQLFQEFPYTTGGDDGDSVTHFMLYKSAWYHHDIYGDQWAKPLVTLIMSCFAHDQKDMYNVTVVNVLFSLLSGILAFFTAKNFKLKYAWISLFFTIATPGIMLIHSGLTEPTCLLIISMAMFFVSIDKFWIASILISFTPFIRSEGLVLIIVFCIYFFVHKKYKYIPALLVGTLLFELLGIIFLHKSFLWTFNEISYAVQSQYGKGDWIEMYNNTRMILGQQFLYLAPLFLLTIALLYIFGKQEIYKMSTWFWLIAGLFFSFIFFHYYARAFGKFGSFGLVRVFIAIMSLQGLIYNFFFSWISEIVAKLNWINWITLFIFLGIIKAYAHDYEVNKHGSYDTSPLYFTTMQQNIFNSKKYLDSMCNDSSRMIYSSQLSTPYIYNLDMRDDKKFGLYKDFIALKTLEANKRYFFIWDDWYSKMEDKIDTPELNLKYNLLKSFEIYQGWDGNTRRIKIYEKVH